MLDLADALDGFDDPAPRDDDALPTLADVDELPNRKHLRSLVDLEREGFNTEPPWPGFDPNAPKSSPWLDKILTWSDPFLPGLVVNAPEALRGPNYVDPTVVQIGGVYQPVHAIPDGFKPAGYLGDE